MMRLTEIKIIHFGQLSHLTFSLKGQSLAAFLGANEAGKSTTVAFIKQVMFGFHLRSRASDFFENYRPLAHVAPMGGSLVFETTKGSKYELKRFWVKGDASKKGQLTVKKDGQIVPAPAFFSQIHKIDGNFYTDSFIFNEALLGHITQLKQDDLLERIYYLGAANSNQLLNLKDNFFKKAANLFKQNGRKPEVNRLLNELKEKRRQLTDTDAQFEDYRQLAHELQEQQQNLKTVQLGLKKEEGQFNRLQRLKQDQHNFQSLKALERQVQPLKFDAHQYQRVQTLEAQLKNAIANQKQLQEQRQRKSRSRQRLTAGHQLIQSKTDVLQWQNIVKNDQASLAQVRRQKQQLLAVNPELSRLAQLTKSELKSMQGEQKELQHLEKVPSNQGSTWPLVVGALFLIGGLVGLNLQPILASLSLLGGLIFTGWFLWQRKVNRAQTQVRQNKIKNLRGKFRAKYGLSSERLNLNNLLPPLSQFQLLSAEEENKQKEIAQVQQRLASLSKKLGSWLGQRIDENFKDVLQGLKQVAAQVKQLEMQEQQLLSWRNQVSQLRTKIRELKLDLEALFGKAQVADFAAYQKQYQVYLHQTKVKAQIAALRSRLGPQLTSFEKISNSGRGLEQRLIDQQKIVDEKKRHLQEIQEAIADIKAKEGTLAGSEAIFKARQELANTETNLIQSSKDYLANYLAALWIDRALNLASNQRFPKMLTKAKTYLNLLTGGRYRDLSFNKKLTVTRFDGKKRKVEYLSRGTAEQLYFALKLAFIDQIKDQVKLPILIDDSFVNFDEQRVGYIVELLRQISRQNQILLFTTQKSLIRRLGIYPLTFKKEVTSK